MPTETKKCIEEGKKIILVDYASQMITILGLQNQNSVFEKIEVIVLKKNKNSNKKGEGGWLYESQVITVLDLEKVSVILYRKRTVDMSWASKLNYMILETMIF